MPRRYFCVWRHPPIRQLQIARLRFERVRQPLLLHSCDHVPHGHRAQLGQFRKLNDFRGVAEFLLSSYDRPWCWSCMHQAHNALVLPPASTYRCKCHVTIVDTSCPLIPISTSGSRRRHSLSTHLDPSHRGLLPVSHVFVDSSRLLCFLIAPPGHHCVRRGVSPGPSTILRLCPVLSINRQPRSLFLPGHPWLAITCTTSHALHSGLCMFCLLD